VGDTFLCGVQYCHCLVTRRWHVDCLKGVCLHVILPTGYHVTHCILSVCRLWGNYNSSTKSSSFHTESSAADCSLSLYAATERRQNYSDGTWPPGIDGKTTNTNASADTSSQRSHGCGCWCLSSDAVADVEVTCRLILWRHRWRLRRAPPASETHRRNGRRGISAQTRVLTRATDRDGAHDCSFVNAILLTFPGKYVLRWLIQV